MYQVKPLQVYYFCMSRCDTETVPKKPILEGKDRLIIHEGNSIRITALPRQKRVVTRDPLHMVRKLGYDASSIVGNTRVCMWSKESHGKIEDAPKEKKSNVLILFLFYSIIIKGRNVYVQISAEFQICYRSRVNIVFNKCLHNFYKSIAKIQLI